MAKLVASPLISLAINHGSPEMGDKDKESGKHKRLDANQMIPDKVKNSGKTAKVNDAMTAGSMPVWKPPTHKENVKHAAEHGHVESTRRWVLGDISTKQHKENVKRAKAAVGYKL
jgi:hypothetical protein